MTLKLKKVVLKKRPAAALVRPTQVDKRRFRAALEKGDVNPEIRAAMQHINTLGYGKCKTQKFNDAVQAWKSSGFENMFFQEWIDVAQSKKVTKSTKPLPWLRIGVCLFFFQKLTVSVVLPTTPLPPGAT